MATVVKALSTAQLRAGLQEMLENAERCVALEKQIRERASALDADYNGIPDAFFNAVVGQVDGIVKDAQKGSDEWDANALAADIQAAIDVLDLATKRSGDAS